MKRVRVRWHTTEVTDYEHVFEVPDDWDEEGPDFWDGDCSELVEYEDSLHDIRGVQFDEFNREADEVTVLGNPT